MTIKRNKIKENENLNENLNKTRKINERPNKNIKNIFQFLKNKDFTPNFSLIRLNLKREFKKNPYFLIFKSGLFLFLFAKIIQLHFFLKDLTIYVPKEEMNKINMIGSLNKMTPSQYEEFIDDVANRYNQKKSK